MHRVSEWMTPNPTTIEPGASALEALELLIEGGFRHLPVVQEGQLVGIVALEDLRAALPFPVALQPPSKPERDQAREYAVGDFMTYAPIVATPQTSLEAAAHVMIERRIGCVPIVDDSGKLVGIITTSDALAALSTLLRGGPKSNEGRLSELEHLAQELRAERRRILLRFETDEPVRAQNASRESSEPAELARSSSADTQAALKGALAERATRRLHEIDRALERHARGELGLCAGCGQRIPVARLRAWPGTQYCLRCASAANPSMR